MQGQGWEEGEIRSKLAALIEKHAAVPKTPESVYSGALIGNTLYMLFLPH